MKVEVGLEETLGEVRIVRVEPELREYYQIIWAVEAHQVDALISSLNTVLRREGVGFFLGAQSPLKKAQVR